MKTYALILAASAYAALAAPAGAAVADELPLAPLPLTVPQVSEGSFQSADRALEPVPPASR